MSRHHATLLTAIWSDPDWLELSPGAQRLYMLLLSQPGLSFIGHLDILPHRWARYARGTTIESITEDLLELEAGRFVAVDLDTQEVLIRSFVRHDFRADRFNRNLAKALWATWSTVLSPRLRQVAVDNLPDFVWTRSGGPGDGIAPPEALQLRRSHDSQPPPENSQEPDEPTGSEPSSADGRQPLPPPPPPRLPPSSSREPRASAPGSCPQDDDDDRRVEVALAVLADRDLADRQTATHLAPLIDVDAWTSQATAQRRRRHHAALRQLADEHPAATPAELAQLVDPPRPSTVGPSSTDARATVYDGQQRAERERAEEHMRQLVADSGPALPSPVPSGVRDALRQRPPTEE